MTQQCGLAQAQCSILTHYAPLIT